MKKSLIVLMMLPVFLMAQEGDVESADAKRIKQLAEEIKQLEEKLLSLEERLYKVEAEAETVTKAVQTRRVTDYQQALASKRIKKDSEIYSEEELDDIEKIYQAGVGRWATKSGQERLKLLIRKYPKANRTGCALLATGESSRGREKEDYLKKAIAEYSDCFFEDGLSVGAWGRYQLAEYYTKEGDEDKAKALYREILEKYPEAVDKRDRALKYSVEKRL